MKIAIVAGGNIPSYWAHSINVMKHAQGFFKLNNEVEIFTIQRFQELILRKKIRNVFDFYGVDKNLKIHFLNDYSPFFFKNSLLVQKTINLINSSLSLKTPYQALQGSKESTHPKNSPSLLKTILDRSLKVLLNLRNVIDPEKSISKECRKKDFDLTYCRTYNAAYYNIKNNIPTVMEYHLPNFYNDDFLRLKNLKDRESFKFIITIHDIIKDRMVEAGFPEDKVLILEDVVDLEKFDAVSDDKSSIRQMLKLPVDKKIILYAGSLREGRGIDTILNAANILKKEGLVFYILGGLENEVKKWQNYIKKNKIRAEIHLVGFKENKLMPYYFKAADILLAPYTLQCKTVKWMSPIKLYEYMASKVPIIASDVKRIKEICENNECFLFKTDDAIDLAKKIEQLINDSSMQKKISENAYSKAQKSTYIIRCKKILEKLEL